MKILIVDDEPKIRRGLENLIKKMNDNWSVIGTASDGISALEVMKKEKPDVLLLDIKMPNMDGFELLDIFSDQKKDVIIIIISGHAEFEYAQKAVRHGVLDYILKPVNPQKVEEVLEKAGKIIAEKNEFETSSAYVQNNINGLREKFLYDIIFETAYISTEEAREKCELLNITFSNFCVATLRMEVEHEVDEYDKAPIKNADIKGLLYDTMEKYEGGYVLCNGIGSFIMVVRLGSCNEADGQIKEIKGGLLSCLGKDSGALLGFGGIYDNILMASASYQESLIAIYDLKVIKQQCAIWGSLVLHIA